MGNGAFNKLIESFNSFFNQQTVFTGNHHLQPGLYHYEKQSTGERSRIHLRVDQDGSGLLIVNANRVIHLNPTAAFMARLLLEEIPTDHAIRCITKMYQVSKGQAEVDYAQISGKLLELTRLNGACPIHDLDLDITAPFSSKPSAPYRMDLALTYRCNNDCAHCYNARPRDYPELSTDKWKTILDQIWDIRIPHVVFTGGEPTLRNDLPELIAHAEKNGQITGVNTNARRLSNPDYVMELVDSGLDHIQVTVESHLPNIHDTMVSSNGAWKQTISGLENALDSPLFIMTNTTMLQNNSQHLSGTLDFLASLGVPTIGLNALIYSGHGLTVGTGLSEKDLMPLLELARNSTERHDQRLIWYTPTQYCNFDPMQLELGVKGCTAALYNMCIEPDGGVIPCQSYYSQIGNILKDPWDSIWNHKLSVSLRNREYVTEKCVDCVLLPECGGGCPLMLLNKVDTEN
jgi:radical SAM protein with 4Fe4S-binding SPASM domain